MRDSFRAAIACGLCALAAAVPTTQHATIAPTDAPSTIAVSSGADSKLHVVHKAQTPTFMTPSPPPATFMTPSPPPGEGNAACTSHNIYDAIAQAVILTQNITITATTRGNEAGHSRTAQLIVLVAIGALSLGLLILGTKFMTGALAVTLFLVVFWFVFGIMDGLTWDEALPSSFSMCVLPLVLSLLSGILASISALCVVQRVVWLAFFLLGACIGAIGGYLMRDIIINVAPQLASNHYFAWYWVGVLVLALLCGAIGAWLKETIYTVTSIAVGSYGFATMICGIVPVVGGRPLGSAAFIAIMVASAAVGGVVQYMLMEKKEPAKTADDKSAPLMGK